MQAELGKVQLKHRQKIDFNAVDTTLDKNPSDG